MSSQDYWRAVNFLSLRIQEWEDGFTVFQPDSGKTHFLNPMAMRLLEKLHSEPSQILAEEIIGADLVERFASNANPLFLARVNSTLGQLDELGLIEHASPDYPHDR